MEQYVRKVGLQIRHGKEFPKRYVNGRDIKMYDDHIALTHKHVAQIFAFSNFQRSKMFLSLNKVTQQNCLLKTVSADRPGSPRDLRSISGKWNSIDHCDLAYASYDDQSTWPIISYWMREVLHGNHNHHQHFPHLIGEMKWSLSFF